MNERIKTALISIIIVLVVFSIGYSSYNVLCSVEGPETSQSVMSNASASPSGYSFESSGVVVFNILLPLMIIGVIILVTTILFYTVRSPENFERTNKVFKFLISSAYYFAYGVIFVVILAVPSYLAYLLYNYSVVEGNTGTILVMLKWVAILTGVFFGIAGLGYVFKKYFVDRLKERLGEKEYKQNMDELPKGEMN